MASERRLEYKDFDLQKVKLTPDGLLTNYLEKGGETQEHTINSEGQPHPHLTESLEALQEYFADRIGLLKGWNAYREAVKGNQDMLKQALDGYNAAVSSIKVSGFGYTGKAQLLAVKITGSVKCDIGSYGMATPNITFASDKLGYEKVVEELTEKVKEEVYLYHFKHKRAQQDLLDQAAEAEEEAAAANSTEDFTLKGEED